MSKGSGHVVTLPRYSKGYRWHNNSVKIHPFSPTLNYGIEWKSDGITCKSRTDGMLCRTSSGIHGAFISWNSEQVW
jgi:hypothetical protein